MYPGQLTMNQSNAGFIDFIDETLGLKLDPSLDWAPLQEQVQDVVNLNWESSLGLQRLARRIEIHKSLNVHNAAFRFKPMYDQFLGQCLESILNDAEHFDTHAQAIPAIMRTLTFQNTESIDSNILAKIAPGFKEKLDEHYGLDWLAGCLMDGLYYSTQLWNAVGVCISDKLATLATLEQPDMDTTEFRLIHRYLPDLVTFSNELTMSGYFRMYGIHPTYRLNASQIQRFLVGLHHNVASWRAVIELLEQEPYTTEGAENFENQLRVIETKLSTLVVDPIDSMPGNCGES